MEHDEFFQLMRKLDRPLTPEQREAFQMLLNNPAGDVELTEEELTSVAGGSAETEKVTSLGCCGGVTDCWCPAE